MHAHQDPAARRARPRGDDGFSLAEAVISCLVLALLAGTVASLIGVTLKVGADDRRRVAASNLAARELEIVRNQFRGGNDVVLAVVGAGTVTDPNPLGGPGASVLDGVPYTVRRTAVFAPTGTGSSACDGGSAVTYPAVKLSVEVTWAGMGSTRPVRTDSVVTPRKDLLGSTASFVAVKVTGYSGAATPSRPVQMTGPSGSLTLQTDDSGCAVFAVPTPGTHSFTVAEPGYVDFTSATPATRNVAVTAGSFKQVAITWDRAVRLDVALLAPATYALPVSLPSVTVYNPGLPSAGVPINTRNVAAASAALTQVGGLGPYTDGWTVWAGGCSDASPAVQPTNSTTTSTMVAPGGSAPVTVTLGTLDLQGPPGAQVVATHSGGTCLAGQGTLTLGTLDATGRLATSLPYGNWTVSRSGGAASAVVHPVPGTPTPVTVP